MHHGDFLPWKWLNICLQMENSILTPYFAFLARVALVLLLSFLAFANHFLPCHVGCGSASRCELSCRPGSVHYGTGNNIRYQKIDKPWQPSLKFLIQPQLMKEINRLFTTVKLNMQWLHACYSSCQPVYLNI